MNIGRYWKDTAAKVIVLALSPVLVVILGVLVIIGKIELEKVK